MSRLFALLVALVLLLACGIVHGLRAERWQQSPLLADALARVEQVPLEAGPWRAEAVESDPVAFEKAGAQAWWARQYRHPRRQTPVLAILMCGRAGRMAVHTPEVCYHGAGYGLYDKPTATPIRSAAGSELGTFFTARFVKSAGRGADLRLYWAWNGGAAWQASNNPRWEFRGDAFLYKLYVSHDAAGLSDGAEDAAAALLRDLGPQLEQTLLRTGLQGKPG